MGEKLVKMLKIYCKSRRGFGSSFHQKNCRIVLGDKTRENAAVLDFLAVVNFDFTRKIVKKKYGWKIGENVGRFIVKAGEALVLRFHFVAIPIPFWGKILVWRRQKASLW